MLYIIFLAITTSCTMFSKRDDNEMEKMGEMVLKKGEGLEIDFKPIPKDH